MVEAYAGLSATDLAAVADLERRVVAADGGRLKLEWVVLRGRDPRRTEDFVWREEGRVVGYCGVYAFGGPETETTGMVDPDLRRRGIGTALLDAAVRAVVGMGAEQLLLVTPRSTPASRHFALARGGELEHSEHVLVLGPTPPAPARTDVSVRDALPADEPALRRILAGAFGGSAADVTLYPDDPSQRQLVVEQDGDVVGCLRLSGDESTTGVYGFAVEPALQGRGIGRAALATVCRSLRDAAMPEVTIEVEVDNDHALGLYTSLGFEPFATDDYYRIPLPTAG
jgi:ribosomal protein S18 acetylase RimI-like enzyme